MLPPGELIDAQDDDWVFPEGTILIKNFFYSRDRRAPEETATLIIERKFASPSPKAPCQLQGVSAFLCQQHSGNSSNTAEQCAYSQAELLPQGLGLAALDAPLNRSGAWGALSITSIAKGLGGRANLTALFALAAVAVAG